MTEALVTAALHGHGRRRWRCRCHRRLIGVLRRIIEGRVPPDERAAEVGRPAQAIWGRRLGPFR